MNINLEIDDEMIIPENRFNNEEYIKGRCQNLDNKDKIALGAVLRYIYSFDAPKNVPINWKSVFDTLEEREKIIFKWLRTRITSRLRFIYGDNAIRTARESKYKCKRCSIGDVRVLNLDHVNGRDDLTSFQLLCANCHMIKSRQEDWTGIKRINRNN